MDSVMKGTKPTIYKSPVCRTHASILCRTKTNTVLASYDNWLPKDRVGKMPPTGFVVFFRLPRVVAHPIGLPSWGPFVVPFIAVAVANEPQHPDHTHEQQRRLTHEQHEAHRERAEEEQDQTHRDETRHQPF